MATLDLDTTFIRCLKFLHSKSPDSVDQLRLTLLDAIRQKHGGGKNLPTVHATRETAPKSLLKQGMLSPYKKDELRKESEKRTNEKLDDDFTSVSYEVPNKIMKLNSPKSVKQQLSLPSTAIPVNIKEEVSEQVADLDNDSDMDDADDLAALKILEDDLTCVVCKAMDVGVKNRLLECLECHSLYHQECHKPPISDEDANDPRQVWYCSNCTKSMKKASKSGSKLSGKISSTSTIQDVNTSVKNVLNKTDSQGTLFKRSDKGHSGQLQGTLTQAKPVGMAAFAASLKPSSKTLSSKSDVESGSSIQSTLSSKTSNSAKTDNSSSVSKTVPAAVSKSSYSVKESSSLSGRQLKQSSTSSLYSKPGSTASNVSSTKSSATGNSSKNTASTIISADKRLQIMKKKAAKLQEKRKLPK